MKLVIVATPNYASVGSRVAHTSHFLRRVRTVAEVIPRFAHARKTPQVKPSSSHGTARVAAWESRSLPGINLGHTRGNLGVSSVDGSSNVFGRYESMLPHRGLAISNVASPFYF